MSDFNDAEMIHIGNVIDYDNIPDRVIVDNETIYPFVNWDRISKMQAIRLVSRNIDLIGRINLKKYNYKIKEIFWFIKTDYTRLLKYFNFDVNRIGSDDAYLLLCLGEEYFEGVIDIERFNFSFIEIMDIIRAYDYKRKIILRLNYHLLKNYQVTEILSNTADENLDLFDLDELSTLNWLELLNYQPEFIDKCDFDKFKRGDPFDLVQLVVLFENPDLSYLIFDIDIGTISPFGWEKLLICNPDKFSDHCNFSKLTEDNWSRIIKTRPELIVYKL